MPFANFAPSRLGEKLAHLAWFSPRREGAKFAKILLGSAIVTMSINVHARRITSMRIFQFISSARTWSAFGVLFVMALPIAPLLNEPAWRSKPRYSAEIR